MNYENKLQEIMEDHDYFGITTTNTSQQEETMADLSQTDIPFGSGKDTAPMKSIYDWKREDDRMITEEGDYNCIVSEIAMFNRKKDGIPIIRITFESEKGKFLNWYPIQRSKMWLLSQMCLSLNIPQFETDAYNPELSADMVLTQCNQHLANREVKIRIKRNGDYLNISEYRNVQKTTENEDGLPF